MMVMCSLNAKVQYSHLWKTLLFFKTGTGRISTLTCQASRNNWAIMSPALGGSKGSVMTSSDL